MPIRFNTAMILLLLLFFPQDLQIYQWRQEVNNKCYIFISVQPLELFKRNSSIVGLLLCLNFWIKDIFVAFINIMRVRK